MIIHEDETSRVSLEKNGPGLMKYEWEVDSSKPPIRLEGHEYKFNSRLVRSIFYDKKTLARMFA